MMLGRTKPMIGRRTARWKQQIRVWIPESLLIQLLSVLFAFVVWHLVDLSSDSLFIPSIPAVLRAWFTYITTPEFLTDSLIFLLDVGIGFAVAVVVGLIIGVLMGVNQWAEAILNPYVTFFYVTPISGIVPLLILWLGFGIITHLTITSLFAVFPIIVNTYQGVKNTPEELLEMANAFRVNRKQIYRDIVVPAAIPYILAGFRLGTVRSITGLILAQLIISPFGFGEQLMSSTARFLFAPAFAVLFTIMFFSVVLTLVMDRFARWAAPWKRLEQGYRK